MDLSNLSFLCDHNDQNDIKQKKRDKSLLKRPSVVNKKDSRLDVFV